MKQAVKKQVLIYWRLPISNIDTHVMDSRIQSFVCINQHTGAADGLDSDGQRHMP